MLEERLGEEVGKRPGRDLKPYYYLGQVVPGVINLCGEVGWEAGLLCQAVVA